MWCVQKMHMPTGVKNAQVQIVENELVRNT